VEIMAIVFSADCQRLIAALTKYDLNWAIWAFINILSYGKLVEPRSQSSPLLSRAFK
jgi:hypothetical protein